MLGAIAGAQHVRLMAKHYGVPVVLHRSAHLTDLFNNCWIYLFIDSTPSDHCAKKLLPWFDGMLEANEEYFKWVPLIR